MLQIKDIPIDGTGRETTGHGSFGFPCALYHTVMSENVLGFVNRHWHEELQLCIVTGGRVEFRAGGQSLALSPGEGIYIAPNCLHMARAESDPKSRFVCLDISPRMLSSFEGSDAGGRWVDPFISPDAPQAMALRPERPEHAAVLAELRRVMDILESDGFGRELEATAHMALMWLGLIKCMPPDTHTAPRRELGAVQAMLAYISREYAREVRLCDVARAASFSPGECCRMFHRVTGRTLSAYIREYRVTRAAMLLRGGDIPVSLVAERTGFRTASYLISCFRAVMGVTPLQYRKNSNAL